MWGRLIKCCFPLQNKNKTLLSKRDNMTLTLAIEKKEAYINDTLELEMLFTKTSAKSFVYTMKTQDKQSARVVRAFVMGFES